MDSFGGRVRKNQILERIIGVLAVIGIVMCARLSFAQGLPWKKPTWDSVLIEHIERSMSDFDLARDDMRRFCPKYLLLDKKQRVNAWAHLMVAIARYESGFNPKARMTESTGQDSIGLFQLSYGDRFCPKRKSQGNLEDPHINISCAVKLAALFVNRDKVVARGGYVSHGAASPKALSRYWSVIRTDTKVRKHKLKEIQSLARKAPGC